MEKINRIKRSQPRFTVKRSMKLFKDRLSPFEIKNAENIPEKNKRRIIKALDTLSNKGKNYDLDYVSLNYDVFKDVFFTYLTRKYGALCLRPTAKVEPTGVHHFIGILLHNKASADSFVEQAVECASEGQKMIVAPLAIFMKNKEYGHQNLLIYRPAAGTLELFEPHGNAFNGGDDEPMENIRESLEYIVKRLNAALIKNGKKGNVKLVFSDETCPTISGKGIQYVENLQLFDSGGMALDGYCVTWSFLICELSLDNPELTVRQINQVIFEHANSAENEDAPQSYLMNVVRGYAVRWSEKLEKEMNKDELKAQRENQKMYIANYNQKFMEKKKFSPKGFSASRSRSRSRSRSASRSQKPKGNGDDDDGVLSRFSRKRQRSASRDDDEPRGFWSFFSRKKR